MTDTAADPVTGLAVAEADAAAARARLSTTVAQLQARLDPKRLAREAKDAGAATALAGVERARRNPGLFGAALAAAGLLLARHRLAAVLRRRRARKPVPAQPISHEDQP